MSDDKKFSFPLPSGTSELPPEASQMLTDLWLCDPSQSGSYLFETQQAIAKRWKAYDWESLKERLEPEFYESLQHFLGQLEAGLFEAPSKEEHQGKIR